MEEDGRENLIFQIKLSTWSKNFISRKLCITLKYSKPINLNHINTLEVTTLLLKIFIYSISNLRKS
jgi:hypothetical protein